MRHFCSAFLLSVGSFALFLGPLAARADSIPTLTATTAFYSNVQGGPAQYGVGNASFSFGGEGCPPVVFGYPQPGQSLENSGLTSVPFAAFRGPGINGGQVTLDGVTHSIEPLGAPFIVFSAKDIFMPYEPNPVFSAPAAVLGSYDDANNRPIPLQERLCDPNQYTGQSCYSDKILANAYIDVPGIVTFHAFDGEIRAIEFTTTPEPVSYGLTAVGMVAVLGCIVFRLRRRYTPQP